MCSAIAVAIGIEGAATVMKGVAAGQRGDAAKAEHDRAGDSAERAAGDAIETGKLRDLQVAMKGSAVVADQRVIQSGSGADVNIGAPKAVQDATQAVSDIDRAVVRRNAALEAYGLRVRARAVRQQGAYAEAEGKNAMAGTFLGGMGGIVGQAGRWGMDQTGSGDSANIEE